MSPPSASPARTRASRLRLWGPVVVYMAVLFALSAQPVLPSPPGIDDKTEHFTAYGGLALVTLRATSGGLLTGVTAGTAAAAWAIASAYGASDEYHQSFVPGRDSDILDWRADTLGAALAAGAVWAFGIISRSRRSGAEPPTSP